jgi:hypothetical protein
MPVAAPPQKGDACGLTGGSVNPCAFYPELRRSADGMKKACRSGARHRVKPSLSNNINLRGIIEINPQDAKPCSAWKSTRPPREP